MKVHGQLVVLRTLAALPPFGQTPKALRNNITQPISAASVRSRLKELEQMGLVTSFKAPTDRYRSYIMGPLGWTIVQAGADGAMALSSMRAAHSVLEQARAVELAPIKQRWDSAITARMHTVCIMTLATKT